MKPLLAIIFYLLCGTIAAQPGNTKDSLKGVTVIIQPYISTGEDTITWSAGRLLQPGDFAGVLLNTKEYKDVPTVSAMSIWYSLQPVANSNTMIVKLGTLFYKSLSKINPNKKKAGLVMESAQMLFDLEKVYELKLAAFLKDTTLQMATFYTSFEAIYRNFYGQLSHERQSMVNECNYANINALSRRKMGQWQDKIAAELSMLSSK